MGDVGDYWRDHKEYVQEQKQKFRSKTPDAMKRIKDAGFYVEQFNPEHYRVEGIIDWWPSTGTWRYMNGKKRGWGVKDLLKELKGHNDVV